MEFQNFLKFDEVDPSKLPQIMSQYYSFKSAYMDFIVLFRIGEFFETYFEDAINFSNATGVTLTRKKFKSGAILMSGIPYKKLDIYVEKLIKNDFKVVVVNQILKDGNITREVSKIYTKGTLLDLELLNSKENNYLASLYKNNSNYEICYCDISVGDVFITNGNLEEIKCELARISPNELLVPKNSKIDKTLYLPYKFELLDSSFYEGEEKNPSLRALLNYSKFILKNFIPRLEKTKIYNVQKNLLMDFITRKNLELTKNSYNNKKYGSILWALDNCKTPMGKRLLSSYISSPLYDIEEINKRHLAIEEFLSKQDLADKLGELFENIGDISRLTSRLSNGTITPLEFCTVKDSLKILSETEKIISNFKSEIINQNIEDKQILTDFYEILDKTLEDDIELLKAGNYIKKNADPTLDVLNLKKEEYIKEIKEYETALQAYTKIPSLKIVKKTGYYSIEVPIAKALSGGDFRLVQQLKSTLKYTTGKLLDLEEKIFSANDRIEDVKKSVFEDLRIYAKTVTEAVRKYSKKLALIDVIYSFYVAAKENSLIRPEINLDSKLEIKEGRHIAAEKIFEKYEPLDINVEPKGFVMLTGANGSGKSTLLKEIGSIIILAQSGSFIPSKYSKLPLVDKLFTILNVSDEFINKKSTHQAQMKEVLRIIENATDKSLILLDEIGKNTSYGEGVAIYFAIIRYLLEEKSAKTVFITHFHALKNLFDYFGCKILYLEITDDNGKRRIKEGVSKGSLGILTAQEEKLPEKLINYANEVLKLV